MILEEIVRHKREEVLAQKQLQPLWELKCAMEGAPPAKDFGAAIARPAGGPVRVIAEVKKASPSRGVIREDFDPVGIARIYEANGASAISVLTDEKFFQGSPGHLRDVSELVSLPTLRKDFIIDEYQVYHSRVLGAAAVLLIVAILSRDELRRYLGLASEVGMQGLVEVHDEVELEAALGAGARFIGVNNRNLKTFEVDISTTARLVPLMPAGMIVISESGVKTREDVALLGESGAHAVLVGETLMASADIGGRLRELAGV